MVKNKDLAKGKKEEKINSNEMQQKLEDLELVNSVNIAVNHGKSLEEIVKLITKKTRKLFSGSGIALYLLSNDGKYLVLQSINRTSAQKKKIEKLIKIKIPRVRLPLAERSYYYKILKEKKSVIINDDVEIIKLIREFIEVLPDNKKLLKRAIRKLIPQIYKIMNIKSVMIVPLISNGDVIGLIDISGKRNFNAFDLERISAISEQLAVAIKRNKIEKDLKDAHTELDQIFDVSVDGIVAIDRNFNVLKVNRAYTDLFGLDSEDIRGKKCFEVAYGEECNTKNCFLKRILNGKKFINEKVERINKNGKKIICDLSSKPIYSQKGKITGIIEGFKDITLQEKAFKKIKENENKFRELFNNRSSGVVVYEPVNGGSDFIIRDLNKAAEEIDSIKKEKVIGESVLKAFPGVKDFGLYDIFKRVYRTGKPEKYPVGFYKDNRIAGWRRNYIYKLHSGEIVVVYDDLTREKKTEKLLRDSEKFSSSLMENSPNPIVVFNSDYSMRYINTAMEKLTGCKSSSLIGKKPPYPWWIKGTRNNSDKFLKEISKKRVHYNSMPIIGKGGKIIYLDIKTTTIKENGKLRYILGTGVDVTEKREANNILESERNKLKSLIGGLANTGIGIDIVGLDYKIYYQNKILKDKFGKISGKFCYEKYMNRNKPCDNCKIKKSIRENKVFELELQARNKRFYKLLSAPFPNPDGTIDKVIEVVIDITETKKTEEELVREERDLREAQSIAHIGSINWNLETNKISMSDEVYRILKIDPKKFDGNFSTVMDLVHPEDNVFVRKVIDDALDNKKLIDIEHRMLLKNKHEIYISMKAIPFYDESNKPTRLVGTIMDVTKRKEAEKLLKDSDKFSSSLMENSPNPIIVLNSDTSIRYVNMALENIIGIKSNKLLGKKPPYPWWPKKEVKKYREKFSGIFKRGCIRKERHYVNKMGVGFWVEVYAKSVSSDKELEYVIMNWFDITDRKVMEKDLRISYERLKRTLESVINTLAAMVETGDPYTSGHQRRVSKLSVAIARELGLSSETIECIRLAATIHDIGKINIPASILTKPGKLTDIEFSLIKTHAQTGYNMIKNIEFPMPIAKIILQHHEKMNGSGYPQGLKGEDIMLEARILTVADVVEAMSSDRPYRPALGIGVALEEIKKNKGKLYDPRAVDACVKVITKKGFKFN